MYTGNTRYTGNDSEVDSRPRVDWKKSGGLRYRTLTLEDWNVDTLSPADDEFLLCDRREDFLGISAWPLFCPRVIGTLRYFRSSKYRWTYISIGKKQDQNKTFCGEIDLPNRHFSDES